MHMIKIICIIGKDIHTNEGFHVQACKSKQKDTLTHPNSSLFFLNPQKEKG